MRHRLKNQSGQSMVLTVIFVAALVAVAGAVIDVGSWYRADRQMQATADASALAAAQELPESTGAAHALALDYAERNDGGVEAGDVEFSGSVVANDTVKVTARMSAPGVFSKVFGMDSVTARATATARAGPLGNAKWAAPIGVDIQHEMLQCEPLPCFEQATALELDKVGPGAFHLLNIDGSHGGTSPAILAAWIENGLDAYMPLKWYYSDPGSRFNSSHMRNALENRIGTELLFPVYRGTRAQGADFEYEVVGWVGFHLTGYTISGKGKVHGWFTRLVWQGIESESPTDDDFGTRAISLVE